MIVFDLDGTLALDTHRSHLLKQTPKDWEGYFKLCGRDELCYPLEAVVQSLAAAGRQLGLWTGRSAVVRLETIEWLRAKQLFPCFAQIRMREREDHTDDTELKRQWLHEQNATNDPVTLVFEDRKRVVDMWRSEGIVCCQVAPGDF
jgi:phosphoglycolate phosphatase-like HAD superfamily hydrolase